MKHPTDGALLAMLDGATGALDKSRLDAHVGKCEHCRGLLATLARRRLLVGALLGSLDAPAPVRSVGPLIQRARLRQRRRWQLVAAAASLFVVAAGSATVRSGVVHDVVRWFLPAAPPIAAPAPPPAQVEVAPTIITLEPTDDLQIEFAAVQSEGELLITLGRAARVTVAASDPVPYTLSRGTIAVDNAGSRASYRIALPARFARAAIRIAGRPIFTRQHSAIVTDATREGVDTFRLAFARLGGAR